MSGGTRSYEMARWLVSVGHELNMVTTSRAINNRHKGWRVTDESGIKVHWLGVPYSNQMSFAQRIKAFLHFAAAAAAKAASLESDVIIATSTPLTIALPAVYAAKRRHVPMVFEVRDLWPTLPIAVGALKNPLLIRGAYWLEQFAYRNAAQVIALSPGMRDGVIKTGYPADQVHVIPNSADLEFFNVPAEQGIKFRQKYEWLQGRPLIIYTGAIGQANGLSYLVRLAAKVKETDSEVRFLVLGDGKEEQLVHDLAQSLGVLNVNFFLSESIPKKNIPPVLSAASIAISTVIDIKEMWDNSANKFFDALASGTPVAINHEGWQAELIREKDIGMILDGKDLHKARETLLKGIYDVKWLREAGIRAKQLAKDRFDRDKLASEFEEVLKKSLN